jgi:cell wall-associated NlpC family hydrolase
MRSAAVRAAASLLFVLLASQAALAAPEELGPDPVTRLLMDKGLLERDASASEPSTAGPSDPIAGFAKPPTPSLVQQLRDGASDMVITAMNFLGVPYKRGGNSEETGFDCSGFTRHIFEKSIGLILPRRADDQAQVSSLITINREELKPGDLVFFNTLRRTFSHVGIYIGEGKFIHSPRTGSEVRVEDMRMSYWNKRFTGARRVPQVGSSTTTTSPAPAAMMPATVTPSTLLSTYTSEN